MGKRKMATNKMRLRVRGVMPCLMISSRLGDEFFYQSIFLAGMVKFNVIFKNHHPSN